MPQCPDTTTMSDSEFMRNFHARAVNGRVPICGSIALTDRCNLHCVHCYSRPPAAGAGLRARELDTDTWLRIIDEITGAGCLYLLLTGGEPLLRPDFGAIYRRAKTNGLFPTVFTNGTFITDPILRLFSDLPPRKVEISLYGATAATNDGITGVPGSFHGCMNGIRRLLAAGVNVGLKTVLMTLNRDEFSGIQSIADEFGVKFRFDACIFPRMDGERGPVEFRVSPGEVVEADCGTPELLGKWKDYYASRRDLPPERRLYGCKAGVTNFWVDPRGDLQPCLMVRRIRRNIVGSPFVEAWNHVVAMMDATLASEDLACVNCGKKALCGYCPGFFEFETGSENKRSEFLCAIGERRLELLSAS